MLFQLTRTSDLAKQLPVQLIDIPSLQALVDFVRENGGEWSRAKECILSVETTEKGERLVLEIYDGYRE